MKITFFGTRGSIPVSGPEFQKTGGNTTCVGIESECLPLNFGLCVDSGSGFIPCSRKAIKNVGLREFHVLHTHWHHDHTQGMAMSPLTFMKSVKVTSWGPVEANCGPREVIEYIMKPPFFPVDFSRVGSHFEFMSIANPDTRVIAIHPTGGITIMTLEDFERGDGFVSFAKKGTYPINTCLIIKMRWTNHPERTISYRFEEGPTGQVFVFVTDHENQAEISRDMINHIKGADLLVMDSQYSEEQYRTYTAGFGHGTPDFCARVAILTGAKNLGLTHHAPESTDKNVDAIVEDAKKALSERMADNAHNISSNEIVEIFACRDYMEFDISEKLAVTGSKTA